MPLRCRGVHWSMSRIRLPSSTRAVGPVVALAALLAVGGCAPAAQHAGAGMRGADTRYHRATTSCSAPNNLPGTPLTVTLADMGMTRMMGGTAPRGVQMMLRPSSSSVPAGEVSLVGLNVGWRTHELVVLPLAPGSTIGQRIPGADGRVDETGALGEASATCAAGTGEGIESGTAGWTTLTLAPGRYELVCNLENHYADGMYAELVVR